ncbi:calcium-binding protein [Anabaena cylindrica FACHB-243]|uniref:Hemolysin-type calcium-binding region n=1 Tax=Anabaena cylindrica (strain ATCC 27899 / PCC 7122) TaxID=272123 RepID=K9ZIU6_ANACC|nr:MULTISPECIES: calcium-binding protein [Anabaena]AFZ59158.1 Hemolysin-type calcium-binding region [Anabaena cylindrica PCC 7122]MBD2416508.1 calcium-binding protein [Anabaena cylindrica FACHB-243]MBY5281080.1 calcium-binding protein [Anabaena sp. CCAP 1446/1C]MBY5309867.1 calcium-binding protein [Anabaena sp. CCAP 1446/1C]MCM2407446.1 calcium-binding protein [Anabaena sp. CCAP 1446/1C]
MAIITGTPGDDILTGTVNNDVIDGLTGADQMSGLAGLDVYYVDNANDIVNDSDDNTVINTTISYNLADVVGFTPVSGGTGLTLNLLADAITGTGTKGNDTIVSFGSNTTLIGLDGDDILKGGEFSLVRGQGGNDVLEITGLSSNGTLIGGRGNDTYNVYSTSGSLTIDESTDNGNGVDTIVSSVDFSLNSPPAGVTILGDIENLELTSTAIFGEGNALNNTIFGNIQNNTLLGLAGNDTIYGNDGNDQIDGGADNDTLEGNAGDDLIYGGDGNDNIFGDNPAGTQSGVDRLNGQGGNDTLTGGLGIDVFEFGGSGLSTRQQGISNSIGRDTIVDFNSGQGDQIYLRQESFTELDFGVLDSSDITFVTTNNGIGANDSLLVYNTVTGELLYNQNGSATGIGDGGFFATLTGAPTLTASDIVVI